MSTATQARSLVAPLSLRQMFVRSVAVLVVVAAVIMAGLLARDLVLATKPDHSREALDAARARTAEVLSYDAATLDADLAVARAQVTGEFARQFEQLAGWLIQPESRERSIVIRAEVVRTAVISQSDDRLQALLFVNQTMTSPAEREPRHIARQLVVTVSRVGDQWLISDLRPV